MQANKEEFMLLNHINKSTVAGVDWWVEQIQNPTFSNGGSGQTESLMAILRLQQVQPLSLTQKKEFGKLLTDRIQTKLDAEGSICLFVDYAPYYDLGEVANSAGIPGVNFPIKTTMTITKNRVSVNCGYGADEVILYNDEAHPEIEAELSESNV